MKRKTVLYIMLIILIFFLLFSPIFGTLRSLTVMVPYSLLHSKNSILSDLNVQFKIPGGLKTKQKDWYPFVMTFNDDKGLSRYIGEDVNFTVLYNFGAFETNSGCSSYFNENSEYYGSFYGGYVIKSNYLLNKFGFTDNQTVSVEDLAIIPKFDQMNLVLPTLGCPYAKRVFETKPISIEYGVEYIGYSDWVRIDSDILTNGPEHIPGSFMQGYLQFGKPKNKKIEEEFPVRSFKGRVYVKYFDEFNATFVLYIMSHSSEVVDICDRSILSNSLIKSK